MTYKVGQTVFVVNALRKTKKAAKIEHIGRKWATLSDDERFYIETGELEGDNYSSPGKIYTSRAVYEYEAETGRLLKAIENSWN